MSAEPPCHFSSTPSLSTQRVSRKMRGPAQSMDDVTWQTLRIRRAPARGRGKRAECPRALLDTRADP